MQHPGIAQIYEAGTGNTGFGPQPYFAMELVHGLSVREYCDQRKLSTGQRLEVIARICDAVQHAHGRGLIHRDLKPGNIVVDEEGQPRILDFGIARLTDSDAQATRQTDLGQLIGTLAYMSPEQVLGEPADALLVIVEGRAQVRRPGADTVELGEEQQAQRLSVMLDEFDQEFVGLAPVKARVREIAALPPNAVEATSLIARRSHGIR